MLPPWIRLALTLAAAVALASSAAPPDWPAISRETRPWTRWWWMGSAVDPAGITRELESFREAGLGGVEITPIYGVAGAEPHDVPFLADAWVRLLEHTLREGGRLDLGVDMATGTGWPFGGPWVSEQDASRALAHRTWTIEGARRVKERLGFDQPAFVRELRDRTIEQLREARPLPLLALIASSQTGRAIDLTRLVSADGVLDWTAPPGTWSLHGVFLGWHGKRVERAAPGGEGSVIDHFSRDAIRNYLSRFDRALTGRPLRGLRALFNDSYEVDDADGQANGTPALFAEFERRRGYDLRDHLSALVAPGEAGARVVADYRETISDLLLETFTAEWRAWAHGRGAIVRNQAHGSPANLLDLYAASDIPETEGEEIPRFKWATSAAHVAGRRLVSAEAATWLGEHFRSTLADVRAAVDRFFVAGVNHIVYHGTAYSPERDAWPGWLFYAAVEFNTRNPWWRDLGALNAYITRVQSFLQAGAPDADVLVYYPFYDDIAAPAGGLLHFGGANPPPRGSAFEAVIATLQRRGFTHDYISDRQIATSQVRNGAIVTAAGASYKALVLPASRYIPLATFERVIALARGGATVIAFNGFPEDVSGAADLERRRVRYRALRDANRTRVLEGADLDALLTRARISREALVDAGLEFTRRRYDGGRYYFLVNSTGRDVDRWIPLADTAPYAVIFDPMQGRRGDAPTRRTPAGELEVRLAVPRHGSLIVATASAPAGERYPMFEPAGPSIPLDSAWRVRFTAGGPTLPAERQLTTLSPWTSFGDGADAFSGTAAYTTTFARPEGVAPSWQLDFGRVHDSARVRLNGHDVGTLIGPSFGITLDRSQLAAVNELEVHVSNLMANRIAALDRAGVPWRKFHNVNFPSRLPENRGPDGLFTAAAWRPLDSGLLGPVTLTPLRIPRSE